MSNRNFDSRVIIQRLQDKNYARNLYLYNTTGQRILHNPQNSNSGALKYTTYHDGSQTMYFRGLIGGGMTVDTGGIFGIPPYPGFGISGSGGSVVPVITAPSAPSITSILSGNQQLTVSFLAPVSDGGSVITDYQYSTNINAFSSIGATVAPFIITGLTNGTTYDVALRAINSVGAGPNAIGTGTPSTSGSISTSWAINIGGVGTDQGFGITTDLNNNVIGVGTFNTSTFIPSYNSVSSNGIISTTSTNLLTGNGGNDAFIVKYTPTGTLSWATNIGGSNSDQALGVTTDINKDIYVTGSFINSTSVNSFNSIVGSTINTTLYGTLIGNSGNIFISKYNTSGLAQWATNIGSPSALSIGYGITSDSNKNIYVVGNYSGSSIVNSFSTISSGIIITSTFGNLSSIGMTDAFIAKYTSSGTALWATNIGGSNQDQALGVTTDIFGNVYVTGVYNGTGSTFINSFNSVSSSGFISTTTFGRFSGGSTDIYVTKYNSSGIVQWATNAISIGGDASQSVATDIFGNVYVTGYYTTSSFVNSYNSVSTNGLISTSLFGRIAGSSGTQDAIIIKYNSSGMAQWATNITGTRTEQGLGIITDTIGNVYVTGRFAFGGVVNSTFVNSYNSLVGSTISTTTFGRFITSTTQDAFVAKYTSSGIAQWFTTIDSIGGTNSGNGINIDTLGNIYVIGDFSSPSTIINSYTSVSSGIINVSSAALLLGYGSRDAFIVKYNTDGQFVI